MIEIGAKELPETVVSEAIKTAQATVRQVCEIIEELREKAGVEKEMPLVEINDELYRQVRTQIADNLRQIKQISE